MSLPTDDKCRKALPIFRGPLMYFPDALLEVARLCRIANDQHNPGEPMHWARGKSTEQLDTALRHMMDHGMGTPIDSDGVYHMAKAAWRCLAELQLTIERDRATPRPTPKVGDRVRVLRVAGADLNEGDVGADLNEGDVGSLEAIDENDTKYNQPFKVVRDDDQWDWVREIEVIGGGK